MRIGFACKYHSDDKAEQRLYNFSTTTWRALQQLSPSDRATKLHILCRDNLHKLSNLLAYVGALPPSLRMLRLSGDVFPLRTHPGTAETYRNLDLDDLSEILCQLGNFAREKDIRLSFHPGQFTVLGSRNERVVEDSIQELEYHAWLLTSMGYSGWHDHGVAINIHAGSKSVPLDVLRQNIGRLSENCRNFLTIENDEFSWDLVTLSRDLGETVAIVPDLHHEWIHSGIYVQPDSCVVRWVLDSWRGVRPKLHCAFSREDILSEHVTLDVMPHLAHLIRSLGLKRAELRKHSDSMWHPALMDYYAGFTGTFDIMVEAKHKQVAARQLYDHIQQRNDQRIPSI